MRRARLLGWVAALSLLAGCEGSEGGQEGASRGDALTERQKLLATCPARARGFSARQQDLARHRGLDFPNPENDLVLDPVVRIAQDHLNTLPEDQRGAVGIDSVNDRVVVHVTRNKDEVLAELRTKVRDPRSIEVEAARWSEELAVFARRIDGLRGLDLEGYGHGNARNRGRCAGRRHDGPAQDLRGRPALRVHGRGKRGTHPPAVEASSPAEPDS